MPVYDVCRADQLVEGRGRPVRAGALYLAVFLDRGRVHAVENQCHHAGSPLDGGAVERGRVRCPWHGWVYDLATGNHLTAFGERRGIGVFPCWIEDGMVKVTVNEAGDQPAGEARPQAGIRGPAPTATDPMKD